MSKKFDVIVVGGGHAGCEAAAVAARMGARTALVSFDHSKTGAMSCNPAIGGLGKGHLVREVDAFDGLIAKAADLAAIHYRMLNRSKGSAVHGPRVQADRRLFGDAIRSMLQKQAGLVHVTGEVSELLIQGDRLRGVKLADGANLEAEAVILCTGTFLGGRLFRGEERLEGGRIGESSATRLAEQLRSLELPMARLKTGTPPRLDGRTIDWSGLERQASDVEMWTMSAISTRRANPQIFCAITRTNERSHNIIRKNLNRSPLFAGAIAAEGPRYCPSIEDKIHRFGDRDGHQVFLEPEGLSSHLIYPNGISTSLPVDVQIDMLHSMAGLEKVQVVEPGYAVEYDHLDPRCLSQGLEVRALRGLFTAGQINGTTGYEEAAAQGLIAGMHAACAVLRKDPPALDRANSYMAVMVDDLTLHGVSEPYRMLTSRAEYRLRLRANNATTRLTALARDLGALGTERQEWFEKRMHIRAEGQTWLAEVVSNPTGATSERRKIAEWLRADEKTVAATRHLASRDLMTNYEDVLDELVEDARYAPYVERQDAELRDLRAGEELKLGDDFPYDDIPGISNEMVERLSKSRPETLSAAGRVRGITPAALSALLVHARRLSEREHV